MKVLEVENKNIFCVHNVSNRHSYTSKSLIFRPDLWALYYLVTESELEALLNKAGYPV